MVSATTSMAVPATKNSVVPGWPTVPRPMAMSTSPRTMITKRPCRSAKWAAEISYS